MNYYIADTHFGHENIIRLCNRPFVNASEMNEVMIQNWNSVVKKNDDVYILGDFAFRTDDAIKIIKKLNGRKHLVKGNHDKKNLKNPLFKREFVEVEDSITVKDNGVRIQLYHYPIAEWDGMYREAWHFFGHIHNNKSITQEIMKTIPKAVNVGADLIGFIPRTAKELMEDLYDK